MTVQKPIIAIDKDDTLNWLTYEFCKKAGVTNPADIPHLDQIKNGDISDKIKESRAECFKDPCFWESKPYGLAFDIVQMAKDFGFEPTICTKTITKHPKADQIIAAKFRFWQKYFSEINIHIVTGEKTIDAMALIDDSINNCIKFNKKDSRPFLVWDHSTGTIDVLKDFYGLCQQYKIDKNKPEASLVVIKSTDEVLAFKRSDNHLGLPCGSIDDGESPRKAALREVYEETGVVIKDENLKPFGTMTAPDGTIVHCFFSEIKEAIPVLPLKDFLDEGIPVWINAQEFVKLNSLYKPFNHVLLFNLKII
jgi:8-oxo-dGTP pyrophosphatase MutT (NUDIX family)/5'(3')-deoxyribonucleotidase